MSEQVTKNLAAAIVERAVKDWKKAVHLLATNPDYRHALETKEEVEEFFTTDWFDFLCEINPNFTDIQLQESLS